MILFIKWYFLLNDTLISFNKVFLRNKIFKFIPNDTLILFDTLILNDTKILNDTLILFDTLNQENKILMTR